MLLSRKTTLIYFILLALLLIGLRLPAFSLVMDTDGSTFAFLARQMLRGEILYDRFHPDHQLPGIYYTYLLAFKLFGDNPNAPQLLVLGFILASTWLIFLMGRMFHNDRTGMLGAFFYILGSSQLYLDGMTAQREFFANLPIIGTMLLFLILHRRNASAKHFFWVGVLGGICILYKIIFVGPLIAAGISLCIGAWLERTQTDWLKKLILRLGLMAMGGIFPLVLAGGYFASMGLWQKLVLTFSLGFRYVDTASLISPIFPKPFGFSLFMLAMNNIAFLVFGLIGTYRLIRRAYPLKAEDSLTDFTLAIWLIISLALAGFRGGGFPHYILVVIPPLALITGIEISLTYQRWLATTHKKSAFLGAGVMTVLIVINFFWRNYDLYRQYIPGQVATYRSSQEYQKEVFEYIETHTTPNDFIYVWSINLQTYYYTDRLYPIDIPWNVYVSATGPAERIFDPRTKYIIMGDAKTFPRPPWLLNGLEQTYRLETTINGIEIYRRKTP